MGFLDNLFNKNPTTDWRAERGLVLLLNLDDESFCGIRLGDRADRLQKFGPAGNAQSARIGMYEYIDKGFLVHDEQGRFAEVTLYFAPSSGSGNYAGAVRRHGREATLTGMTTEADLREWFGTPETRTESPAEGEEPAESYMVWRLNRTDCSANFENDRLVELWLGTKM